MFETLNDIPQPIAEFYQETEAELGLVVELKPKGRIESLERLSLFIERGVDEHIKDAAKAVLNGEKWQFLDEYLFWLHSKPSEPELLRDDAGLILTDENNNQLYVDGITPERYQELLANWQNSEPQHTERTVDDVLAATDYKTVMERQAKLKGVEFEGVMCSATKEDMWGLNSVQQLIAMGGSTNFRFDNGNKLLLTPDNIQAFQAVWIPFRQSFFQD
ncbi:hypothetical protein JQC92_02305 [Shewanella sp. 202IG2-18]|uniref:hypothetical protein n=1 Tax=Parashewanella hymeniacidonis TaxID=2807618 RepID=UPI0019603936|nr:hypothetical protein [Parashewanella hymeniacidonis]MBM7070873.1 hypothetical protein [Parashewanella hymeniacidonis]